MANTTSALLVPRSVRNLNTLAEQHGFSVSTRGGNVPASWRVEQFEWSRGEAILSTWKGTKSMLDKTGLLAAGYRIPFNCGWWSVPYFGAHCVPGHRPLVCGVVWAMGNDLKVELWGGPIPQSIEVVGDVEISRHSNGVVYHGAANALVAGNFCAASQLPGKRDSKRGEDSTACNIPEWHSRRFPDGSIAHWREIPDVDLKLTSPRAKADTAFRDFMARVLPSQQRGGNHV